MSYAIEIEKQSARLVDLAGRSRRVEFYLHTTSAHGNRTETVSDRLNDPSIAFVPCAVDGRTSLLRLASIAYVELDDSPPELDAMEQLGAHRTPVELELVSGEILTGHVVYEAPRTASRVSDLLNHRSTRFLFLVREAGTVIVQREAIARVEL